MNLVTFHQMLVGGDPTPEHLRLYESEAHGFSNDERNEEQFLATFVLGLYQARDWEAKTFRKVTFAIPKVLDSWTIEKINTIIKGIHEKRKKLNLTKEARQRTTKMIIQAITSLEIGSRVFTLATEPSRWVAFGFGKNTPMPKWLEEGLL